MSESRGLTRGADGCSFGKGKCEWRERLQDPRRSSSKHNSLPASPGERGDPSTRTRGSRLTRLEVVQSVAFHAGRLARRGGWNWMGGSRRRGKRPPATDGAGGVLPPATHMHPDCRVDCVGRHGSMGREMRSLTRKEAREEGHRYSRLPVEACVSRLSFKMRFIVARMNPRFLTSTDAHYRFITRSCPRF